MRCVECGEEIVQELCPAIDLRTGQPLCDPCDSHRKDWRSRLVFSEVVMAEVDTREVWE